MPDSECIFNYQRVGAKSQVSNWKVLVIRGARECDKEEGGNARALSSHPRVSKY